MMLNRRTLLSGAAGFAAVTLTSGPASAHSSASHSHAANLTVVEFDGGSFERINANTWQEFSSQSNQARFTFEETHFDEWSLYLTDSSRNIRLQFDVHRRMIGLGQNNQPIQDQWQMTNVSNRINGRLVSAIAFAQGTFQKQGGEWVEMNSDGEIIYRFQETGRDMWSVYARDDSRQMDAQFDMHRLWISLAWPGHAMADQYRITASR